MGTDVSIVGRNERLVPSEEPEISDLLLQQMSERMHIFTSTEVTSVRSEGNDYIATGRNRHTGEVVEVAGQHVLVATGRSSNADILQVEKAGIKTDARGYIVVDDYLETNVKNIWALGDIIGKYLFKHSANREAVIAWHNSQNEHRVPMNYNAVPHAVFSYPQIASVGLTEEDAKKTHDILVGRANYDDVAYGMALVEEDGFAKAVVDAESLQILGFHIIGPHSAILIQEVVNAMAAETSANELGYGMHIHPALSELVLSTFGNLAPEG